MRRWLVASLCAVALLLSGVASASPPTRHAWDISLFAFRGGSTATQGHVRDAPVYLGITSIGPWCCEVGVAFERVFNASRLRGSVSGTIIVNGSPDNTRWEGKLHGSMTPEGASGMLVVVESAVSGDSFVPTGRKFVGSWSYEGHADQSVPHSITIHLEGMLLE